MRTRQAAAKHAKTQDQDALQPENSDNLSSCSNFTSISNTSPVYTRRRNKAWYRRDAKKRAQGTDRDTISLDSFPSGSVATCPPASSQNCLLDGSTDTVIPIFPLFNQPVPAALGTSPRRGAPTFDIWLRWNIQLKAGLVKLGSKREDRWYSWQEILFRFQEVQAVIYSLMEREKENGDLKSIWKWLTDIARDLGNDAIKYHQQQRFSEANTIQVTDDRIWLLVGKPATFQKRMNGGWQDHLTGVLSWNGRSPSLLADDGETYWPKTSIYELANGDARIIEGISMTEDGLTQFYTEDNIMQRIPKPPVFSTILSSHRSHTPRNLLLVDGKLAIAVGLQAYPGDFFWKWHHLLIFDVWRQNRNYNIELGKWLDTVRQAKMLGKMAYPDGNKIFYTQGQDLWKKFNKELLLLNQENVILRSENEDFRGKLVLEGQFQPYLLPNNGRAQVSLRCPVMAKSNSKWDVVLEANESVMGM
ncbi:hypothetical protein HYALB_00000966 [Hymenoscyphus albidus]|uniref:Uncharacterized protein n=1 Tax=Hymenoscyphus albidus TaxID=595503 RepID=A0A9N9M419_9HELO|nr:hypothetical protein HYALB_00000966 [Hymenoscyphus albidus]